MRPAIALAAALLALAACSNSPGYQGYGGGGALGDVIVYWNFVDGINQVWGDFGQTRTGCNTAAVDSVVVNVAGQQFPSTDAYGNPSCVGANGVPGVDFQLPEGSYPYSVQGFRGQELVYEYDSTMTVLAGASNVEDATLVAISPQTIPIYYALPPGVACAGTLISYSIYDATNTLVDASPATGIPCDPSSFGLLTAQLPFGNYTLGHLQALYAYPGAPPQVVAEVCDQPLTHVGIAQDFTMGGAVGCPL